MTSRQDGAADSDSGIPHTDNPTSNDNSGIVSPEVGNADGQGDARQSTIFPDRTHPNFPRMLLQGGERIILNETNYSNCQMISSSGGHVKFFFGNNPDVNEGTPKETYDAAEVTFWKLYNSDAEARDTEMTSRWKGDMDSILIFAGLFSAVLTAFLSQAYQALQPNATNGPVTSNSSPTSILVGNILWFISLGFSLSAALGAILVQQWIAFYLLRIRHQRSPKNRARVRMYLYEGVETFGMDAVVGSIPTLLHISLFVFYGGLVSFFKHYSTVIFAINTSLLGILCSLYALITVFPLKYENSPFRTPLSIGIQWLVWMYRKHTIEDFHRAELHSPHVTRDRQAARWLFNQVLEDNELEEFLALACVLLKRPPLDADATLFDALSVFSNQDIIDKIYYNTRFFLRTYTTRTLTDDEKTRRIKACEVITPLFINELSKRLERNFVRGGDDKVVISKLRQQATEISLSIMKCRMENKIKAHHQISNEELVIKSFLTLGWRRAYKSNSSSVKIKPAKINQIKKDGELLLSARYLIGSIEPNPEAYVGIDITFHRRTQDEMAPWQTREDVLEASMFYHEAVLLFLLSLFHMKRETANTLDQTRIQQFNMLDGAAMIVTNPVVDVFLLKIIIRDLLSAWHDFGIPGEKEKDEVIKAVNRVYLRLRHWLPPDVFEVPEYESAIQVLEQELDLSPDLKLKSETFYQDSGDLESSNDGPRVDKREWQYYFQEVLRDAKVQQRARHQTPEANSDIDDDHDDTRRNRT